MSDEKPPMPEQPKTLDLPAPSPTDIAIARLTSAVETGFAQMGANIAMVSNDLGIVKDRVGIIESWKNDLDGRASRNSARVQQSSEVNLAHEAQLAQERAAREALAKEVADLKTETATQTQMLTSISGAVGALAKNPIVGKLLYAAAAAAIAWLAKGHL